LATGYDGAVLSGVANVDLAAYTTPALIPGLTATLMRVDSVGAPGGGKGALDANVIGLNFKSGALTAAVDSTTFSNDRTRIRASASFDLGVAQVGVGFEDNKKNGAFSDGNQTAFGVRVPMGAITLGMVYASNSEGSSTLGAGKAQGWGVGADYALSKRTTLNMSYGDRTKVAGATDNNGDQYRIRLTHAF
jgi:predicted porin